MGDTERRRRPSSTVTAPWLPLKPRSMRALVSWFGFGFRFGVRVSVSVRVRVRG